MKVKMFCCGCFFLHNLPFCCSYVPLAWWISALIDIDVMDVIVVSISNWVYLFLQAFLCKNMQLRGFDWLDYIFLKLNVIQGAPIKNNPLGKIHYLSYCNRFFHQIHSFQRRGFKPHTQQISSQYLLWFKIYNHLNLKIQFSK